MNSVNSFDKIIAKIVTALTLSIALVSTTYSASDATKAPSCRQILSDVEIESYNQEFILANGVAVTGDFLYPLHLVLSNLNLDFVTIRNLRGKRVLSLAEGVSALLPFLLQQEVNSRGLDLWYSSTSNLPLNYTGRLMRQYVRTYGNYLIPGDARNIPLENESVDLIVSHMLVNNVDFEAQKNILKEAMRVVKKGGEIRLFGFDEDDAEQVTDFLITNYQDKITYRFEKKKWKIGFNDQQREHESFLLTIVVK